MDRLTTKDIVAGIEIFDLKIGVCEEKAFNLLGQYENTGLTPAEVAELAQAKKDGLLVVLPCIVGADFYHIRFSPKYDNCLDGKYIVQKCYTTEENILLVARLLGKTAFLTKAEAQAALDRMEGQE